MKTLDCLEKTLDVLDFSLEGLEKTVDRLEKSTGLATATHARHEVRPETASGTSGRRLFEPRCPRHDGTARASTRQPPFHRHSAAPTQFSGKVLNKTAHWASSRRACAPWSARRRSRALASPAHLRKRPRDERRGERGPNAPTQCARSGFPVAAIAPQVVRLESTVTSLLLATARRNTDQHAWHTCGEKSGRATPIKPTPPWSPATLSRGAQTGVWPRPYDARECNPRRILLRWCSTRVRSSLLAEHA